MSDRFWAWFNAFSAPYRPLMTHLSAHFGAEFAMFHSGGGCCAIQATFEGYGLLITDAEDTLSWHDERDEQTGYGVGVYRLETYEHQGQQYTEFGSEAIGWASSPHAGTAEKLIRLIELALDSVNRPALSVGHVPVHMLGGDSDARATCGRL